jgi:hypothetical protein
MLRVGARSRFKWQDPKADAPEVRNSERSMTALVCCPSRLLRQLPGPVFISAHGRPGFFLIETPSQPDKYMGNENVLEWRGQYVSENDCCTLEKRILTFFIGRAIAKLYNDE